MTHFKKSNWWAYALAVVVIIIVAMNWKKLFPKNGATERGPTKSCYCGGVYIGAYPRNVACPC